MQRSQVAGSRPPEASLLQKTTPLEDEHEHIIYCTQLQWGVERWRTIAVADGASCALCRLSSLSFFVASGMAAAAAAASAHRHISCLC